MKLKHSTIKIIILIVLFISSALFILNYKNIKSWVYKDDIISNLEIINVDVIGFNISHVWCFGCQPETIFYFEDDGKTIEVEVSYYSCNVECAIKILTSDRKLKIVKGTFLSGRTIYKFYNEKIVANI